MHISLRAGERLFINGAVLRVDRKVSLELMNDATFLLEAHVMRVEDASTPLRQLYFIVQVMLMDPDDASVVEAMFAKSIAALIERVDVPDMLESLKHVRALVATGRPFDALKAIRGMFADEACILKSEEQPVPIRAA